MPPNGRLDTWKQIADFLGREIRTVQRWEKTEGLPIHRHRHSKLDSIYAYESELRAWQQARRRISIAEVLPDEPPASDNLDPLAAPSDFPLPAIPQSERLAPPSPGLPVDPPRILKSRRKTPYQWFALGLLAIAAAVAFALLRPAKSGSLGADLTPEPLAALTGGQQESPSFSPDGKQVAFVWSGPAGGRFAVYIKDVGAHEARRLTSDVANDYSPAWSPDGTAVAYCRSLPKNRGELAVVTVSNGATRTLVQLTASVPAERRTVAWLRNSRSLVLTDGTPFTHQRVLYLLDIKTGAKQQITFPGSGENDFDPAVSPVNTIAYIRDKGLNLFSIHILHLKENAAEVSSDQEVVVPGLERFYGGEPAWTPDGNALVIVSTRGGSRRLWLLREPWLTPPTLLPFGDEVQQPSVSANGQLAYVHSQFNTNIWRASLHGGSPNLTRVAFSPRIQESVRVAPDGKRLVLASTRGGSMNIWTSSLDGSNATPLTSNPGVATGSPAWSPDSSEIAFDSRVDGQPAIYVIPSTGGKARNVTGTHEGGMVPVWARDGRSLYYSSNRSGRIEIWQISLDGSSPKQVTEDGGFAPDLSPDGKTLYYERTSDVLPALWSRDLATGEEKQIERSIYDRLFAPAADGVYYVPETAEPPYSVYFYSGATATKRKIFTFTPKPRYGMSISPDGSTLFMCQEDINQREIMLVREFWR